MAEETQVTSSTPQQATTDVAVEAAPVKPTPKEPEPELKKPEEAPIAAPPAPAQPEPEPEPTKEEGEEEAVKKQEQETETAIAQSVSFKEESNLVSELPDHQKKALDELKSLIQTALNNHDFTPKPQQADEPPKQVAPPPQETSTAAPEPSETTPVTTVTEVVTEVVATTVVDEDGAKTVEAIEESVVSVSISAPEAETPTEAEAAAEAAAAAAATTENAPPEEVSIWGIPLLGDERSNVVLLKFLRARDFKVKDAFAMIKNTIKWRREFGIEALLEEEGLGSELEKVVFMHGVDKEGHPVCYNVYGEFQNKDLYAKTFSDEEKRHRFLRWRIQFLEKGIRQLDFSPTGINTLVQVTDLKNSPGPAKRELRQATNQALSLLQDNYPEFVAKQIFINVPWWYLAFNRMISPFLTQRTKSKFVFAGPSKTTETLFRYIAPEQVPVQYGGLSQENDPDFTTADAATEFTIKPASKHTIEIPVSEVCVLVWELRVIGWDVSYCAEFVPSAEDGYTVIVQKTRKMTATDEPIIKNSFKIGEPGKVVLTIDNTTSKKKKLVYRYKTKSTSDSI